MKKTEMIVGMVIIIFGLVTVVLSWQMPIGTFRLPGTGLFPLGMGLLLIFLAGLFILTLYVKAGQTSTEKANVPFLAESTKQIILFFGAMILATALFNHLGYPLTSLLLLSALLKISGMKRWSGILGISFGTMVITYMLFVKWLQIPLPRGFLGW